MYKIASFFSTSKKATLPFLKKSWATIQSGQEWSPHYAMTQLFKRRNELRVWARGTEGSEFGTCLPVTVRTGSRKWGQEEGREEKHKQFHVSCYIILSQPVKELPDTQYPASCGFVKLSFLYQVHFKWIKEITEEIISPEKQYLKLWAVWHSVGHTQELSFLV